MKNFIQFLIFLISLNSFAQIRATILKTNGEVLKGFASISDYNSNIIKFRKNIDDRPQSFGYKDIDEVFLFLKINLLLSISLRLFLKKYTVNESSNKR